MLLVEVVRLFEIENPCNLRRLDGTGIIFEAEELFGMTD